MARTSRLVAIIVLAVGCCFMWPDAGHGWGTLTGGSNLSPKERADLQTMLDNYGVLPKVSAAELDKRLGAHPIHQLVVYEAALMLARDPATRDGKSGFPSPEAINGWDGVDRCEQGIRERAGSGLVPEGALAPPVVGPSADAELAPDATGVLQWNSRYAVRAHYWNPWLDSGDAPTAAGANFSKLAARLIAQRGDAAHVAAYLAHYVSDALSAKHADAIMLTLADLATLDDIGKRWMAARTNLTTWLESPILAEGVAVIEARARALGSAGDAWLERVSRHIDKAVGSTTLRREDGLLMTIAPSTLDTAVACFLHDLRARPTDKSLDAFYTYFDPFYFNGPIFHPLMGNPSFQLCSPLSEHMQWETNPQQAELAHQTLAAQEAVPFDKRVPLMPGPVRSHYAEWAPVAGFESLDRVVVGPAFRASMADLVRRCSRRVHGAIGEAHDFVPAFRPALDAAISCVFTAFRASVTGLRGEAFARRVGTAGRVEIQLRVKNLADRPAQLEAARVGYYDGAWKYLTRPGWETALSETVAADDGGATDIRVSVDGVPDGVALEDLFVDVRATIPETPDRGWLRVQLVRQPLVIGTPGSAGDEALGEGAPTDIVVVFDTTSSMQSSLDALARDTVSSIKALREKTDDIRLAVVTFRDLGEEADRAHFQVRPFTRDLDAQFGFLQGLAAGGGGDTPEDLLDGLSRAIALWEEEGPDDARVPAKLVLVVTDAPGKSPDVKGNTFASIAKRAREVDPAHVYPIIVGHDAEAMRFGQRIAGLTDGEAVHAESGDQVAKVLSHAALAAIGAHAGEAGTGGVRWGLIVVGGALCMIGVALGLAARARDRRRGAHG